MCFVYRRPQVAGVFGDADASGKWRCGRAGGRRGHLDEVPDGAQAEPLKKPGSALIGNARACMHGPRGVRILLCTELGGPFELPGEQRPADASPAPPRVHPTFRVGATHRAAAAPPSGRRQHAAGRVYEPGIALRVLNLGRHHFADLARREESIAVGRDLDRVHQVGDGRGVAVGVGPGRQIVHNLKPKGRGN